MLVNFEELKTLYQSLYVDLDILVTDGSDVSEYDMTRANLGYDKLALIAKLAQELCKFRPKQS